jgi:hypothetical protein
LDGSSCSARKTGASLVGLIILLILFCNSLQGRLRFGALRGDFPIDKGKNIAIMGIRYPVLFLHHSAAI